MHIWRQAFAAPERARKEVTTVPQVTVMLPAYNVGAYLQPCIESVLAQTYRDFELLIIDDGSTDTTAEIADRFAAHDPRVKVIHQPNAGISHARNVAVQNAQSEWLTFVDADDWLEPTYLSYLLALQNQFDCPLVACNHWIESPKGPVLRFAQTRQAVKLTCRQACENMLYLAQPDVSQWGKLFHRSLFRELTYPEGKLFEDTWLMPELVKAADGIAMGCEPQYHYRYYDTSISKTTSLAHLWDYMDAVEHMASVTLALYPELASACNCRRVHAALSTKRLRVRDADSPDMSRANRTIRKHLLTVLLNPRVEKRTKLGALAALPGDGFYRLIWRAYAKRRRNF